MERLWNAAICDSTKRVYRTALQYFMTFLILSGMTVPKSGLPRSNEEHLLFCVTHCQKALMLKSQTINLYLAGIRFHYIKAGQQDITSGAKRLKYILREIKK